MILEFNLTVFSKNNKENLYKQQMNRSMFLSIKLANLGGRNLSSKSEKRKGLETFSKANTMGYLYL